MFKTKLILSVLAVLAVLTCTANTNVKKRIKMSYIKNVTYNGQTFLNMQQMRQIDQYICIINKHTDKASLIDNTSKLDQYKDKAYLIDDSQVVINKQSDKANLIDNQVVINKQSDKANLINNTSKLDQYKDKASLIDSQVVINKQSDKANLINNTSKLDQYKDKASLIDSQVVINKYTDKASLIDNQVVILDQYKDKANLINNTFIGIKSVKSYNKPISIFDIPYNIPWNSLEYELYLRAQFFKNNNQLEKALETINEIYELKQRQYDYDIKVKNMLLKIHNY